MEKVENLKSVKSLYKGGFILLLGFLLARFGGFIFRIICMNILPVSAYGEVAVFIVLYNWFVLFATFNVTIGLAKFVSENPKRKELFYLSSIFGSLIISFIIAVLLFLITPWISASLNLDASIVYWAIASVPFAVIYNIGIFYFRGLYRMKSSVLADAIMTVIRIVALVGLLLAGLYFAPYLAFLLSFMLIDIYLLFRNRTGLPFKLSQIFSTFRQLLIYSMPIFISEFLRLFSLGVDRVMLSGFYSTVEAGFYDVAVMLCIGYIIIANSYSNALLPMASSNQADKRKRRSELGKALRASSGFFVLYTIVIMLAARPVINLVNPYYIGAFDLLPPLALAYIFIGFLTVLSFFANGIGYQRHAVYSGAVFAFLSLILNFYLIPTLMYWGAIYSLLVSSAGSLAVMALLIWKVEK
jgi:O-antigen/teichoic acid export membrane protein